MEGPEDKSCENFLSKKWMEIPKPRQHLFIKVLDYSYLSAGYRRQKNRLSLWFAEERPSIRKNQLEFYAGRGTSARKVSKLDTLVHTNITGGILSCYRPWWPTLMRNISVRRCQTVPTPAPQSSTRRTNLMTPTESLTKIINIQCLQRRARTRRTGRPKRRIQLGNLNYFLFC